MQPQHLISLVKVILDKTETFIDILEQKAATGDQFRIDEYTTNLAFDVIGECCSGDSSGNELT
jgi:hypothetical protein